MDIPNENYGKWLPALLLHITFNYYLFYLLSVQMPGLSFRSQRPSNEMNELFRSKTEKKYKSEWIPTHLNLINQLETSTSLVAECKHVISWFVLASRTFQTSVDANVRGTQTNLCADPSEFRLQHWHRDRKVMFILCPSLNNRQITRHLPYQYVPDIWKQNS